MPPIPRLAKTLWRAMAGLSTAVMVLATGAATASQPLAGTTWQLVAIQSMDDAQGRTVVPQPEHFMLSFATDGSVALRLDCNRGAGRYQAEAASAGTPSGHLTFEGIAVTRALCLPPGLDARVTRDLAYVRSYLFQDGKLFLSLMADGGILEWAPVPERRRPSGRLDLSLSPAGEGRQHRTQHATPPHATRQSDQAAR